jgi:hypothetical protein
VQSVLLRVAILEQLFMLPRRVLLLDQSLGWTDVLFEIACVEFTHHLVEVVSLLFFLMHLLFRTCGSGHSFLQNSVEFSLDQRRLLF